MWLNNNIHGKDSGILVDRQMDLSIKLKKLKLQGSSLAWSPPKALYFIVY